MDFDQDNQDQLRAVHNGGVPSDLHGARIPMYWALVVAAFVFAVTTDLRSLARTR